MKPAARGVNPARRDLAPLTALESLSVSAGDGEADLLDRLALWLADVSAEAALREPDAQPEGQGELVALERTAGRRRR